MTRRIKVGLVATATFVALMFSAFGPGTTAANASHHRRHHRHHHHHTSIHIF